MTDVVKTRNVFSANRELDKLVAFNKGRKRGQYKYAYISQSGSGYVVRLSQKKPTSKTARSIRKIRRR